MVACPALGRLFHTPHLLQPSHVLKELPLSASQAALRGTRSPTPQRTTREAESTPGWVQAPDFGQTGGPRAANLTWSEKQLLTRDSLAELSLRQSPVGAGVGLTWQRDDAHGT